MSIDFGVVKKYFPDKGFGFVNHTFISGGQTEIFFHIRTIKKTHPDLARRLTNEESLETIFFWYDTEITTKGEQVSTLLKSEVLSTRLSAHLPNLLVKIEALWVNIDSAMPAWLREATADLVGPDRAKKLESQRKALEDRKRADEALKQKEREILRKIEEEKRQKIIKAENDQKEIEENEFNHLVAEMRSFCFTQSAEVSSYIVKNKLGYKYKNISGILEMEKSGTTWTFKGGFPPKIYARLCEQLNLGNKGSNAKPKSFTPFKDC